MHISDKQEENVVIYQYTFQAEETTSETRLSTYCYHSPADGNWPLHCHAYYELSYVWSGERYEQYRGNVHRVGSGSLFLMEPLVIHGNQNITPVHDMVIQFSLDFLWMASASSSQKNNMILGLTKSAVPYIEVPEDHKMIDILQELRLLCEQEADLVKESDPSAASILRGWQRNILVLRLLTILVDIGFLEFRETAADLTQLFSLETLINRILAHPSDIPDMREASLAVGMSYYSFSRFFKRTTGVSYHAYCNQLRLQYAENSLVHSNKSIAEIAREIGIDTASYFTRMFKQRYGISPMQFRQQHKRR